MRGHPTPLGFLFFFFWTETYERLSRDSQRDAELGEQRFMCFLWGSGFSGRSMLTAGIHSGRYTVDEKQKNTVTASGRTPAAWTRRKIDQTIQYAAVYYWSEVWRNRSRRLVGNQYFKIQFLVFFLFDFQLFYIFHSDGPWPFKLRQPQVLGGPKQRCLSSLDPR